MKKIKFSNKLSIEQTTIALLDQNQMAGINGGAKGSNTCPASMTCLCTWTCPCITCSSNCPKQ